MEQLEIISWKILDAIRNSATKTNEVIGDIDTNEHMSVFCQVDDDYIELYYSEVESSYFRHFEDEDEFFTAIDERKSEFGEEEFGSLEYFTDEDEFGDENSSENFDGYNIKEDGDEDEF